jgi:four helix bundle protein
MTPQVLEERLIDFAVSIVTVVESLPNTKAGNHIANQLIRSGTSPAPNYGEAQSAESRKDFIHKLGIVMKELRETQINLKMLTRLNKGNGDIVFSDLIKENDELLAIMFRTIQTARKNN